MTSSTRFVTTPDGVRLAVAEQGSGPAIVLVRGWITHVEVDWEVAEFRALVEGLGAEHRVVRYDHRGMGLSDRDVEPPGSAELQTDLETVVDSLDLGGITLWGSCFGGPIAIRYAARHPARVSRLVLDGTFLRADDLRGSGREGLGSIVSMVEQQTDTAAVTMSYLTNPTPTESYERQAGRVGASIDGPMLGALYRSLASVDVVAEAATLEVPTLVLHRRRSRVVPFEAARTIAATVPGARLVGLEGDAHNVWDGDPGPARRAVEAHLGRTVPEPPHRGAGVVTILFTDLVGSTEITTRRGDEAAQQLLRAHDGAVRDALGRHGGREVKHTGDGIFAAFDTASAAVACARDIQSVLGRDGGAEIPPVRIGLNAGEPVAEADDLFGSAVQRAARICDAAAGGEVLVANVVRDLVAGKGFDFEDRGQHRLKGLAEPVRLWALR